MARHPWLDPGPFFFEGGRVGVLLIHGFTGAPTEMRGLGEHLAAGGYTVSGPLLPGHGTEIEDLAGRKWPEWAAAVEAAFSELADRCDQVFVGGMSLGSLLTANLAAERPVAGIILISPAIFLANPLARLTWITNLVPFTVSQEGAGTDLVDPEADKRAWCYEVIPGRAAHQVALLNKRVVKLLPRITAPALVVMSSRDAQLKYESGPYVIENIASADKTLMPLHNSGHNILVDAERESVWEATAEFIGRIVAGAESPGGSPGARAHPLTG
jgi:carboxylesterase